MKKKSYGDLVLSLIIIALSVFFVLESKKLPESRYDILGPGGWPGAVGLAMGVLGIVLLVRELLRLKKSGEEEAEGEKAKFRFPYKTWGIFAAYVVVGLLLKKIGFSILMFFYMIITLYLLGERKWWKILLISVIATWVVSVVFLNLLGISMPEGKGILRTINRAINMKNLF